MCGRCQRWIQKKYIGGWSIRAKSKFTVSHIRPTLKLYITGISKVCNLNRCIHTYPSKLCNLHHGNKQINSSILDIWIRHSDYTHAKRQIELEILPLPWNFSCSPMSSARASARARPPARPMTAACLRPPAACWGWSATEQPRQFAGRGVEQPAVAGAVRIGWEAERRQTRESQRPIGEKWGRLGWAA